MHFAKQLNSLIMTRCNEQTSHPASHVQPFKTSLKNVNSGMCFSTLDAGCSIALHTRRTVAKYKSKQNRVAIRLAIRTPWGGVDTWGLGFGFVIGTKKSTDSGCLHSGVLALQDYRTGVREIVDVLIAK